MNLPGLESPILAILIIVLLAAVPVFVIFSVLRWFRKKTERGREKSKGPTLKSVKEERIDKKFGKKHD
ncbi:hypothetical protein BH23BAC1_BH23BAC1_37530 [soil metagenome]